MAGGSGAEDLADANSAHPPKAATTPASAVCRTKEGKEGTDFKTHPGQ